MNETSGSADLGEALLAVATVFVIMLLVPFPVYGGLSALGLVQMPEQEAPGQFFLSVVVMKIGVALGFVLLYRLAAPLLAWRIWQYAAIWFLMYAIVEVGQAIGPGYSTMEAVGGVVAEAIYFPLSALVVARLLPAAGTDR